MRPMDKATADSLSVQSFAIIKNTGHGNFVIRHFRTRAKNGLFVPSATDIPSLIFSVGRGRLYTGYLKRIIHLQIVRQNWRIKSGGLFIQNQNPFHLKLRRITYLTRIIKRITYLTSVCSVKTAISVIINFSSPWFELGVRVSAFAFSQRLFLNWLLTFLCVT